jgi:hypothetical protein
VAAAGSAASSRWASKLQQLQQQAAPTAAAAAVDDGGSTSAEESASDDELDAYAFEHSSSSSSSSADGSQGPRQLREAQMPPLCSVRQLAGLLGVQVTRLEDVLQEQLGEEVKSGAWLSFCAFFVHVLRGSALQGVFDSGQHKCQFNRNSI